MTYSILLKTPTLQIPTPKVQINLGHRFQIADMSPPHPFPLPAGERERVRGAVFSFSFDPTDQRV